MARAEDFEVSSSTAQYEKKEIKDILNESKQIDVEASAVEILRWITNNVEYFIDNQKKMFKLDLMIDAEEGAEETMPVTRRLQDLYRAIPEDPELSISEVSNGEATFEDLSTEQQDLLTEIQKCRATLDTVTNSVFLCMKSNEEVLPELFKRMSYYYELKGVSHGNLLVEELDGEVDISKFEYEAFPVGVRVTAPIVDLLDKDNNVVGEGGGETQKEYVIPEGFTVWLEIAFKTKQQQMGSMF